MNVFWMSLNVKWTWNGRWNNIKYVLGSRHKNWYMAKVLNFLIRYFSNYYILHRSDLAAWAAPLDPRLRYNNCPYLKHCFSNIPILISSFFVPNKKSMIKLKYNNSIRCTYRCAIFHSLIKSVYTLLV